jgi:hypothetical protein
MIRESYISRNRLDIVKGLLDNNTDVNSNVEPILVTAEYKRTPLYFAVLYRSLDMVKLLLEHKADASVPGPEGDIPLHYAAWEFPEAVPYLIQAYPVVDVLNIHLRTPLADAIRGKQKESVELLLDAGARVSAIVEDEIRTSPWFQDILKHRRQQKEVLLLFIALGKRTKRIHKDLLPRIAKMSWEIMRKNQYESKGVKKQKF